MNIKKMKKKLLIGVVLLGSLTLVDLIIYFFISSLSNIILFTIPVILGVITIIIKNLVNDYKDLNDWYEQILDFVYLPMSVTDIDMNWTFINKPVKDIIGVERGDIMGEQCHKWGADICDTPKCGVMMLRNGNGTSYFTNEGVNRNFQVDTSYLYDRKNSKKKIGHIEVVSDVTTKTRLDSAVKQLKKSSTDLTDTIELEASATEELSATSVQFSHNITSISNNTSKQFTVIEDTVSALEEMSASIESVSQNSTIASKMSRDNVSEAKIGETKIKDTLQIVSDLNNSLNLIADKIHSLNDKTQKVDDILKVITKIASQTNLLAMNAAIEAAHAGEAGKGFSVVASEIGKLADSAQSSSKSIEDIIKEIKTEVINTKELSNNSQQKVEKNITNINDALGSIDQIVNNINRVDEMIVAIDSTSKEQAVATGTILSNAKNLQGISHEIKDSIEEQADGIQQITNALQGLVEETNKNVHSADELKNIANKLEL